MATGNDLQEFAEACVKRMNATTDADAEAAKKKYEEAVEELRSGAIRPATFIAPEGSNLPGQQRRDAGIRAQIRYELQHLPLGLPALERVR